MKPMAKLLAKYEALPASLEIIQQHLRQARDCLRLLPSSNGRSGLVRLTEYLACQTAALGVVSQTSL